MLTRYLATAACGLNCLPFYIDVSGDRSFHLTPEGWGEQVWQAFWRLMSFFDASCDVWDDGLCRTPAGRRHYIDWSPTSQQDPHLVYNLHVVLALQTANKIVDLLGLDIPTQWLDKAAKLRRCCRDVFFHNGIWYDDGEQTTYSQLGAAMVLLTGTVDQDEIQPLCELIAKRSLDLADDVQLNGPVLASPFMHHYLFQALDMCGRPEVIVKIIRRRWGRWVDQGEPTTWENWDVSFPDGSTCHAFSAHPRYHLAKALGALPAR